MAEQRDSLLRRSPHGAAGHHRLGPGAVQVRKHSSKTRGKSCNTICSISRTPRWDWTSGSSSRPSRSCCWAGARNDLGVLGVCPGRGVHLCGLPAVAVAAGMVASLAGAAGNLFAAGFGCDGGAQRGSERRPEDSQSAGAGLSCRSLQIVVVSDGSTDGTDAILAEQMRDPRVRVVHNQLAQGKACGIE